MATISKFPRGFLSLLGMQNFGETPRELARNVSSTVDLTRMYLLDTQFQASSNWNPVPGNGPLYGIASGANNDNLIVPPGESWCVHWIHSTVVVPAASSVTFAPAVRTDNGSTYLADPMAVAANLTRWNPSKVYPIWLPAGSAIGVVIADLVGAAVIAGVSAVFTRLRA